MTPAGLPHNNVCNTLIQMTTQMTNFGIQHRAYAQQQSVNGGQSQQRSGQLSECRFRSAA